MKQPTNTGVSRPQARAAGTGDRPELRPEAIESESKADDADALWSVADVGAFLKIPTSSVYKLTARKAAVPIPRILIGGRLRFRRSEIERWLTLLSVSNLDVLTRMRKHSSQVTHGNHSQTEAR